MSWRDTPKSARIAAKRRLVGGSYFALCAGSCKKQYFINDLTLDHVVPLSVGGKDDDSNWQLLCRDCHEKKDNIAGKWKNKLNRWLLKYLKQILSSRGLSARETSGLVYVVIRAIRRQQTHYIARIFGAVQIRTLVLILLIVMHSVTGATLYGRVISKVIIAILRLRNLELRAMTGWNDERERRLNSELMSLSKKLQN